jgi:hypothetical protein
VTKTGAVNPSTVSAPAFLAIALTIVSGDGRRHRVVVRTPAAHSLTVPGGGRASLLIGGLKAGSYAVVIDGRRAAMLVIGGEPGP